MTVAEPLISVVVPTHERPDALARLLSGLRAQTLPPEDFEVVVVADGASSGTHELLAAEAARGQLQLRVVSREPAGGPGAARNAGWRAARGPIIAFTDDDCVPAPGWLDAGLSAADAHTIVQGITRADPTDAVPAGPFSRTVEVTTLGPQFETCNIFYPREVLEELGGFDEGYGLTPGGEDTDLAWRAIDAGVVTKLAPEAVVHHAVQRLGVRGMLRLAARWTAPTRVLAEHPQARAMLYRGVFWNVWHYLLWRSIAALWGPAWLRRLVLTLHLTQLRRRARETGGGVRHVPFLILYDLVESWAIARGGLRYRTPVL